jgi:tetratricopeptide (TPR) repeat protein
MNAESVNAKNRGAMEDALRLREKSNEMWDKAIKAYDETKSLAPNYVQTHHQVGLLYLKRAEQAVAWGESGNAKKNYDEALKNFQFYRMLDPVFPQNYDRMSQIFVIENRLDEAIAIYGEAIHFNDAIPRSIYGIPYNERLGSFYVSVGKLYFTKAQQLARDPFHPIQPHVNDALDNFKKALAADPKNVDALKGMGFLLDHMGQRQEAQAVWGRAHALAPDDPDFKILPPAAK